MPMLERTWKLEGKKLGSFSGVHFGTKKVSSNSGCMDGKTGIRDVKLNSYTVCAIMMKCENAQLGYIITKTVSHVIGPI